MIPDHDRPRQTGNTIGLGTFIKLARDNDYQSFDAAILGSLNDIGEAGSLSSTPVLEMLQAYNEDQDVKTGPLTPGELMEGDYPPAEYVISDFVLEGHPNLLYGDGGTGKTLLSLQMAVSIAAGIPFFGHQVKQLPVLLVLAEDDKGETRKRLLQICESYGLNLEDLPVHTWCRPGQDSSLARISDDGDIQELPFLGELFQQMRDIGQCFVLLDTVTDIANLDETKRPAVNTLAKKLLLPLCRDTGSTMIVTAHPSKASMLDNSHYAGSTAWNNSFRSRLSLKKDKDDTTKVTLEVAKANYGAEGKLELFHAGGILENVSSQSHADRNRRDLELVLETVSDMLARGLQIVRTNGGGQKPKDVSDEILAEHNIRIDRRQVLEHLNALERRGRLKYEAATNRKKGHRAGFRLPDEDLDL